MGRLIDADKLKEHYAWWSGDRQADKELFDQIVDLQPTCNQLATDCINRQDAIDALSTWENEYEWDVLRKLHLHWHWPEYMGDERLSNRLYVFDDQWSQYELFKQDFTLTDNWQIIGRKWDAEFKTPENEHFVRLPILF